MLEWSWKGNSVNKGNDPVRTGDNKGTGLEKVEGDRGAC